MLMRRRHLVNKKGELSDRGLDQYRLIQANCVEHTVPGFPLSLLLDGHSTHYQPAMVRFAKEHGVIMLCLPPHMTQRSQPLDCGVFGPLKASGCLFVNNSSRKFLGR